ncbi:MAG: serine/threonine protein kinase [Myxococcales bacterium]|nr:serine/threonine protein kinase [Myxococcales bacterium]
MGASAEEAEAIDTAVVEIFRDDDSERPERTAPERIGRYQLCFELASGGMATVYLARTYGSSGFEKLVALKRIHRHLAKEKQYIEMFLDEAKIASRITHPNVCSVFDFGHADGEYYIAMEYLVGEPLSRLYGRVARIKEHRRHPLMPLRMAGIIAHACEGLHAAHELKDANGDPLGVVHRDASPRNLFVTYDGSVQVVDFGIASARHRTHHTAAGQVKGTFAYMAPEQLTAGQVDRRVDVWALGVGLWEMLALKRLFRRDTTGNTVRAVLFDEIVPPSAHRSSAIPSEIDEIVLRALARDPEDRWQDARDMGRALWQVIGAQQETIGAADLSDWMSELFPEGEARKGQLMEIARISHGPVPAVGGTSGIDAFSAADAQFSDTSLVRARRSMSGRSRVFPFLVATLAVLAVLAVGMARLGDEGQGERPPVQSPAGLSAQPVAAIPINEAPALLTPVPVDPEAARAASEKTSKPAKRVRSKSMAKTGPGTINIVTRGGWADLYKGGKRLGTTPRRLTLPAGRHKLVLKPFGDGKPKTVVVTVEANKMRNVSIRLD